MKINIPLLFVLFLFISSQAFSQCTASVTNIPHGDCEGTDIELIAAPANPGNTYQWTGPDGFTSTNQVAYIYYASASASGVYKVVITNSAGCSASDSMEVIKHPVPVVYTGGGGGGCFGTTTSIYALDFGGEYGPYSYLWDGGETTSSIPILHSGGNYPAPACLMTNTFGCSAMNNTTFMIYTVPTPSSPVIEATGATSFCKGGSVSLTTTYDPNLTYQWTKPTGDISGATSNSYTANAGGNYRVAVTNGMGCSAISNNINVKALSLPLAAITVTGSTSICTNDSVLLQANTGANLTYQWTKYTNPISGATGSSYYAKTKGNFRVVVTNLYGCTKTSNFVAVTNNCRKESEYLTTAETSVNIYPNPSPDFFNIEWKGFSENEFMQVVISDMTGRIIDTKNIATGNLNKIQAGSELKAGVYFIEMIQGENIISSKIIKTE